MTEKIDNPNIDRNIIPKEELYKNAGGPKNVYRIGREGDLLPSIPHAEIEIEMAMGGVDKYLGANFEDIKAFMSKNPKDANIPKLIENLKSGSVNLDQFNYYNISSFSSQLNTIVSLLEMLLRDLILSLLDLLSFILFNCL